MSFPRVYCNQEERPRQHAVKCDECSQWQHRKCNTGISFSDYNRMVQEDLDIICQCCKCTPAEQPSDDNLEQPMEDDIEEDQQIQDERDISNVEALEASLGALPDDAEESIQDNSFNISAEIPEENAIVESDIEDEDHTDAFIEDRPVTYKVVESGTKRNPKKLISSDGYSYTVKTSSERTTNWRCSVRNKTTNCKATVVQRGQTFVVGSNAHIHPNDPGVLKKTKITVEGKKEAAVHAYKSASEIVEEKMEEILSDDDFNLPKPANLTRAINR